MNNRLTGIGSRACCLVLLSLALGGGALWGATNGAADVLSTLKLEHPRLFGRKADWNVLSTRRTNDAVLAQLLARIEQEGREALSQPPLERKLEGRRLLFVSRAALRRVMALAFCYRLNGDHALAERAEKEMLVLAAFSDWNPSHFLDTAEMTAALGIGYDWLYHELTPAARASIRQAIIEKGLLQAFGPGTAKNTGWRRGSNNWNQVCFGGLTIGSLAIADEAPEVSRKVLEAAQAENAYGLIPYQPAGVYPEGPGYWNYGTTYQVMMLAALEAALGHAWQLDRSPGFLESAAAQLQQTGPTGLAYNFSDGGESVGFRPALYWFAQRLKQPGLLYFQQNQLKQMLAQPGRDSGGFLPLAVFWWKDFSATPPPPKLPLTWMGDGPNPIGIFRSSWTDPEALYLGFKGGSATLNHGHMDAGSFILDADGVRWACELGAQEYHSIESKGWNLWGKGQDADRWRVFRLNNFSHSTLTIGGQLHRVEGDARILKFSEAEALVDLTKIFSGQATRVIRRFQIGKDRSVLIRDELDGLKPGTSVRWQMVTAATVEVAGKNAMLKQGKKTLKAQILAPVGENFVVEPANPPADGVNVPNPGRWILAMTAQAPADGRLRLEISLLPGGSN